MLHARHVRALRGTVTAAAATFVALLSHVTAGGAMPGPAGVVVPLVLAVFVSVLLAGRRLSLWRLTLSVALSQVLFHLLFVLGTPSQALAAGTGHHGHGAAELAASASDAASSSTAHAMHGDSTMWMHHAVAAVLTVALVVQGERLLAGLAAFGWFVLQRLVPLAWLPVALRRDAAAVVCVVPALRTLARRAAPALRRGPPASLVLHAAA